MANDEQRQDWPKKVGNPRDWYPVVVRWLDARGATPSWEPREALTEGPCEILSVGYLVGEYPDSRGHHHLVLAPHMVADKDPDMAGVMYIPRAAVLEMIALAVPDLRGGDANDRDPGTDVAPGPGESDPQDFHGPEKATCSCRSNDAWRCAKNRGDPRNVSCHCPCHETPSPGPELPEALYVIVTHGPDARFVEVENAISHSRRVESHSHPLDPKGELYRLGPMVRQEDHQATVRSLIAAKEKAERERDKWNRMYADICVEAERRRHDLHGLRLKLTNLPTVTEEKKDES